MPRPGSGASPDPGPAPYRQGQEIEEALTSHRPRPRSAQSLIRVLLPVDGRLAKRPTRIGPRLERAVEVVERTNRGRILQIGSDPDPSPDHLAVDGEQDSLVDPEPSPQDRIQVRSVDRGGANGAVCLWVV